VRVRADLFDYKMHVRWITDLILGEGGSEVVVVE